MRWHDVCFAHWQVDAASLARALPPGIELDTYDGAAWLSVVPFRMSDVRLAVAPRSVGIALAEINLRTYVRVGERRGVYFFSLDAASPLAVRTARIGTGLAYYDASIATSEANGTISYTSTRTDRRACAGAFAGRYAGTGPLFRATAGSLEAFLHERYAFFTRHFGMLLAGGIAHDPWALQTATISVQTNTLGDLIAVALPAAPDLCFFAREVRVGATLPERLDV